MPKAVFWSNPFAPMFRCEMRGGVLLATLDMPGRTMNVFSFELMNQLEALMDRVESEDSIGALVITSGKDAFVAGADLEMVRGFCAAGRTASRAQLDAMCGRLGRLFLRLHSLTKPSVAAINGLALGGGLELAMACNSRIAADDRRVQFGLPEIKLGLIAAATGTQVLPRLIGIEKALELMLNGKSIGTAEGKRLGLIDDVVPLPDLVDRAVGAARDRIGKPHRPHLSATVAAGPFDRSAPDAVRRITRHLGYADEAMAHYPAYDAAVRAVLEGAHLPLDAAVGKELQCFIDLMQNSVAGNMVTTLFLERQKSDKRVAECSGFQSARFAVLGSGTAADDLRAALQAMTATLIDAALATPADIVIADAPAASIDLLLLTTPTDLRAGAPGIHVRRSRAYGTAIEIAAPPGVATDKALALARQLRATPYCHAATHSLLATLAEIEARAQLAVTPGDITLSALAAAAEGWRQSGNISGNTGDVAAADVACVVAGVFPAFAGGPFTWLREMDLGVWDARRAAHATLAPHLFA